MRIHTKYSQHPQMMWALKSLCERHKHSKSMLKYSITFYLNKYTHSKWVRLLKINIAWQIAICKTELYACVCEFVHDDDQWQWNVGYDWFESVVCLFFVNFLFSGAHTLTAHKSIPRKYIYIWVYYVWTRRKETKINYILFNCWRYYIMAFSLHKLRVIKYAKDVTA